MIEGRQFQLANFKLYKLTLYTGDVIRIRSLITDADGHIPVLLPTTHAKLDALRIHRAHLTYVRFYT